MHRIIALTIIIFLSSYSFSQQFGGHPPSVRWKQVNAGVNRIIFPTGLDTQARRVASILPRLDSLTGLSIGNTRRHIDIVLQPATTISNAYVGLGPYRSEFYLTPRQNSFELGSLPWVDNLAIHEYRHIQQYNNFRKGLAKAFHIAFGQEGQAVANSLTVPDWFFEGDAVYQETKVSQQGRGRLPYFFNDYRSLWTAGKNYSWMKLRNGSLRDFVPDHYRLGYLLTAYGYEKYGAEFWKKVSSDAASFRGLFYPWQKAIKRYAGVSYQQFRRDALEYFRFQANRKAKPFSTSKHFVADQEYPYWTESGGLVYMETSYKRRPRFVIEEGGTAKTLRTRDISTENYFSYRNGNIVYAAYRPNVRWSWWDYSDLRVLDANTGAQRKLTTRTRYFAPDISADGKTVVAVHVDGKGNSSLHLLDAITGSVQKKLPNSDGLFYTYPKFYNDKQVVTAVRSREGKMALALTDIETAGNTYLTPFSWNVIGFPSVQGDTIYFTASSGRTDKLFAWVNGTVYSLQPNDQETGSYQLNAKNGRYVWTKFTAYGFRLMQGDKDALQPDNAAQSWLPNSNFRIASVETDTSNLLQRVPDASFPVSTYSQSFRLFNFHSRRPYISDPNYTFSFVSQNILNTLETEIFATYNRNEKFKQVGFGALYGALFPVLRLGADYTFDRRARVRATGPLAFWNEVEARAGFSIPLNLTSGRSFRNLSFTNDYVYNKRHFTGFFKDSFDTSPFGYINSTINFTSQVQQARQHIYPRLAQTLLLNYKRAVTNLEGNQFLASGSLYLPGFFQTHNIVLQAAFHRRDTLGDLRFSNSFPFSRGYAAENFHRMWKFGGNYHLPLLYPDWGFANLVYFLRVRSNVFYDHTRIYDYTRTRVLVDLDFRSYGTEIFFDTRWWNQLDVTFGFRYSRLMDADIEGRGPNQWEFILPVNLLQR